MTDHRTSILEAAQELFLEQGFRQTTIQELADHVGISKGAVYLHFRSKADVLLALVRKIEQATLDAARDIAQQPDLSPKEKLHRQLRHQFADIRESQVLFESFLKESGVALSEEIALVAQKSRVEWQNLQEQFISEAFPEHDAQFTTDIAVILNGALNEYHSYVLLEGADIEPDSLADLLLEVADAVANRLCTPDLAPVLDKSNLLGKADIEARIGEVADERIEAALGEIEEVAATSDQTVSSEITETVEAMRHELAKDQRSRVVLQGLIANLREFKQVSSQRKTLAYELGLKLI